MQATYYGFTEEIWELAYGPLKAALFCCQWVRLEEINTDSEGFNTVDLTKTAYIDDPFVLAKDVMQVFYARDNKTKRKAKSSPRREKEDCRCRWSDGRRRLHGLLGNTSIRSERTPTYPSRG